MKWSELDNRKVVSVADAEELGFLADMVLDASAASILGYRVRRGGLITHYDAVQAADIQSYGPNAVTIQDASRLNREDSFAAFGGGLRSSDIQGNRVMTASGEEIGKVRDFEIDPEAASVQQIYLNSGLLDRIRGDDHLIPVNAIRSIGNNLVVVEDSAAPAN